MMIQQLRLLEALRRIIARIPYISDWRKLPTGRIVRFTNWKGKTK